jgi:hypothetical protein
MPNKLPIVLPKNNFLSFILRRLYSIVNFIKSSIVSILTISIIFGLLLQMEQAYTMLIFMVEEDHTSLLFCFIFLNLLAISLSHFPTYTYFAGNLNESKKFISFKKEKPYPNSIFRFINVYTYKKETKKIDGENYISDDIVNILRNYLGLVIFSIWLFFAYNTYQPNLVYTQNLSLFYYFTLIIGGLPYLTYAWFKYLLRTDSNRIEQRKKTYGLIGKLHFIFFWISILLLILTAIFAKFSQSGLLLLIVTTGSMMFTFVFFRLARPRVQHVINRLKETQLQKSSSLKKGAIWFAKAMNSVINPKRYLGILRISFYACFLFITYLSISAYFNSESLPNSLLIVLAFLYFYFYIISMISKYYFVKYSIAQKNKADSATLNSVKFKLLTFTILLTCILLIISSSNSFEDRQNELTLINTTNNEGLSIKEFETSMNKNMDTLYFVSSYGGGLKSNIWTLMVLDSLNKMTNGNFMKQTVSMSGASGGNLGVALYGNICGLSKKNTKTIISNIRKHDYASKDITMLFGADVIHSTFPFSLFSSPEDRAYYNTLTYQNYVQEIQKSELDNVSFRQYWKTLSKNIGYLPILIVNTSSTEAKRGVFCSLDTEGNFDDVFNFSKNLSEIDGKSIPFYEAISSTNRFPFISPAAKISGSGHYIDAGAIDNSGVLSNWDLYQYLKINTTLFVNKTVVFLEIENDKSNYIAHLLREYFKTHKVFVKNENETSAILANVSGGLNLNKIPGYLDDFLRKHDKNNDDFIHKEILLPHKVSISDIEQHIGGKIEKNKQLERFLIKKNAKILTITGEVNDFSTPWKNYEPVLSRHMSQSNLNYYDNIIKTINFKKVFE